VWVYKTCSSHKLGLLNHLVSLHIEAREIMKKDGEERRSKLGRKEDKTWRNQSKGEYWSLGDLTFGVRGMGEKVMFFILVYEQL